MDHQDDLDDVQYHWFHHPMLFHSSPSGNDIQQTNLFGLLLVRNLCLGRTVYDCRQHKHTFEYSKQKSFAKITTWLHLRAIRKLRVRQETVLLDVHKTDVYNSYFGLRLYTGFPNFDRRFRIRLLDA